MADREKVLKALEICVNRQTCEDCWYKHIMDGDLCYDTLMRDALELLKAQEPVEPVVDIDTWKCGNCGHALEHQQLLGNNVLFHEQYYYCPECGKAVKRE